MNILIIILVAFIILNIIMNIFKVKVEGFADFNPNMLGYEEGMPNEYQKIDFKRLEFIKRNNKEFVANNWHLRFPYMVNKRYSYDDSPDNTTDYGNQSGTARLKELPLDMTVHQNYIPLSNDPINYQQSNEKVYGDLRDLYIHSNGFLDMRNKAPFDGFDYNNSRRTAFNAGSGTSDSFYLEDVGY